MYATSLGSQHLRCKVEIPAEILPLAKIMKNHGYWTALRGKTDYNFDVRGLFDHWEQSTAPWRACPKGKPFFSFMNLGSTHEGCGNRPERAAAALNRLPAAASRDPATIAVPPHHPDSPEMRRIWARYHELITVFDIEVGEVLARLEADGRQPSESGRDLMHVNILLRVRDRASGRFKLPRKIYLLDELPRNAMGKVTKPAVSKLFA